MFFFCNKIVISANICVRLCYICKSNKKNWQKKLNDLRNKDQILSPFWLHQTLSKKEDNWWFKMNRRVLFYVRVVTKFLVNEQNFNKDSYKGVKGMFTTNISCMINKQI